MPDILTILLIVNILVLIYFLFFSDNIPKKYKNTYIITVFIVVFITFGFYEYYTIKELFN